MIVKSALKAAGDTQSKCAEVGFDWTDVWPVFDKVAEELEEVKAEVHASEPSQHNIEDELGDLLFAVVNLARHLQVDPEIALRKANEKFNKRFALVEQFAKPSKLQEMDATALEELWQKAKRALAK